MLEIRGNGKEEYEGGSMWEAVYVGEFVEGCVWEGMRGRQ